jgi:glycosyltransferase involved in cell wall biosynthesis
MKRLVVIGPVTPFRGGIAQHTTALCRQLASDGTQTLTLSFSHLYPQWLFPGASTTEPDAKPISDGSVRYIINSVNPGTWIRASREIRAFRPDTVVIAWWTFFLGPCLGTIARLLKRTGIPVVFLCHNVADHESATWRTFLSNWALRAGDGFIAQTSTEAEALKTRFVGKPVNMHLHPVYDRFPSEAPSLNRRGSCELLFFGFVRPYKGLDTLIRAIKLAKHEDIFLTVAGECWGDSQVFRSLADELGVSDKIDFRFHYHSDLETAALFRRADLVVLPYRSATGTGVIPIAYHYGKPVLASAVGGLPDAVLPGRTGFLVPPEDPTALAAAIRSFAPRDALSDTDTGIREMRDRMTWAGLSRCIQDTCTAVCHRPEQTN